MDHIAVMIGQDLHLDMPRGNDAFFQEDLGTAKGLGGLGDHTIIVAAQFSLAVAAANSAPPTAGTGL